MTTISAPDGDLSPEFSIVRGDEDIRQRILQRLRFFRGEWFLDVRAGTPWFQRVLVRAAPIGIVTTVITNAINTVEGVISVSNVQSAINRETRRFTFSADVTTENGQISISEEINA